jgi:hypothetical protein
MFMAEDAMDRRKRAMTRFKWCPMIGIYSSRSALGLVSSWQTPELEVRLFI